MLVSVIILIDEIVVVVVVIVDGGRVRIFAFKRKIVFILGRSPENPVSRSGRTGHEHGLHS